VTTLFIGSRCIPLSMYAALVHWSPVLFCSDIPWYYPKICSHWIQIGIQARATVSCFLYLWIIMATGTDC